MGASWLQCAVASWLNHASGLTGPVGRGWLVDQDGASHMSGGRSGTDDQGDEERGDSCDLIGRCSKLLHTLAGEPGGSHTHSAPVQATIPRATIEV